MAEPSQCADDSALRLPFRGIAPEPGYPNRPERGNRSHGASSGQRGQPGGSGSRQLPNPGLNPNSLIARPRKEAVHDSDCRPGKPCQPAKFGTPNPDIRMRVLLAYAHMGASRGKMQHANSGIFMEFMRNKRNGTDNRRVICRRQWSHELALALSRGDSLELATALASEGVPNHTRMERTQTNESAVRSHSE